MTDGEVSLMLARGVVFPAEFLGRPEYANCNASLVRMHVMGNALRPGVTVTAMGAVRLSGGRIVGCLWSLSRPATAEERDEYEREKRTVWCVIKIAPSFEMIQSNDC